MRLKASCPAVSQKSAIIKNDENDNEEGVYMKKIIFCQCTIICTKVYQEKVIITYRPKCPWCHHLIGFPYGR